ncbi:MAG: putative alpha-L-rhamnosidase, partial [Clostridia bacterium]|nr:putative alpha-L-rhamnosidase [Clostridia bacterium]
IFYDVFEESEKQKAFEVLLDLIKIADYHMDTGILGARVIFHVLSVFGKSDLAFDMITTPNFPSYGNWIVRGATSLWEDFQPEGGSVASLNHHFFGDISSWFIKTITGINLNPYKNNVNEILIAPKFIEKLNHASAYHSAPAGDIKVSWQRSDDKKIILNISVPKEISGKIKLENSHIFEDGLSYKDAYTGTYTLLEQI